MAATLPGKDPVEIILRTLEAGSNPSVALVLAALKACSKSRDGKTGEKIHTAARGNGSIKNSFVASSLIDMYAKCGRMADAASVFDEMEDHTVVSWNCLILGYAENKQPDRALQLFDRMDREAIDAAPNHITFMAALRACMVLSREEAARIVDGKLMKMETLEKVMRIHSRSVNRGKELHIFLANLLVDVYSRCGSPDDSRLVFDRIPHRSVVSWTSMILGYADNGRGELGLELFEEMCQSGCSQNQVTFVAAFKSCSSMAEREAGVVVVGSSKIIKLYALEVGRALHSRAEAAGFCRGLAVANTLIDMYAKCGSMDDSRRVFDALRERCVVSWTGMIMGYAENGDGNLALEFFRRMDCHPNYVTILAAIKACVALSEREPGTMIDTKVVKTNSLEIGRTLHRLAQEHGHEREIFVANALVDMYSKCGSIDDAFGVFRSIRKPDPVSWSSIIQACADNGKDEQALRLFSAMRQHRENISPSPAGFVAVLKSCGSLGDLDRARALELEVLNSGIAGTPVIINSLIVMYGRCGSTVDARRVFDSCPPHSRDLVTWNAMVDVYGRHGEVAQVLVLFHAMVRNHDRTLWPNSITYLLVLSACCHAGLVDESKRLLAWMIQENRVAPSIKHYTCVIDLLGRANRLEEAMDLVEGLPIEADSVVWTSLMDAARRWGNESVARRAFDATATLEKGSAAYVMMSSIATGQ